MTDFKPGQKWISSAEPELGIGQIVSVEHRLVTLNFDLIDETRTYAKNQAPLTRVKFNVGDIIRTTGGLELEVSKVSDQDGILVYHSQYQGTSTAIIETDLDPNVTFSKPEERLFTLQIDENRWFNLRYQTLQHRARLATSPIRGLLGPRVSLIPHQFFIAQEVASRYAPRVLLADEVGLGKTIEAGLIIHQQLMTGRSSRIMVIVPPALKFQWFVEMIRRFNLQFTLLDEERCLDIEADNRPGHEHDVPELDNPFDAQQLVLCSLDLFLNNPKRLDQAATTDWDLIVIDEAHHLEWRDGEPGEDYTAVEQLSQVAKGLLLLTATPEQLGRLGHFGRLRLLDPSRYHSYDDFLEEEMHYENIAGLVSGVLNNKKGAVSTVRQKLGEHAPENDNELLPALLDRHGTGRVLFRNVRESVEGFPKRILNVYELPAEQFPNNNVPNDNVPNNNVPNNNVPNNNVPNNAATWNSKDARIIWLADLLKLSDDKHLVICSRAETAIALDKYLRDRTTIRSVTFHEGLDLVARDRAANYFADSDRGAQVLVCSEIGSEGRNFQFAHQLVMYDLPNNPDLLEQRIGRLDRIGQTQDVVIHVPFAEGTEQARLLRVFNEGFLIFQKPNAAAQIVFDNLPSDTDTDELVNIARIESESRLEQLRSGRDQLLERNSHLPEISAALLAQVSQTETDGVLEKYMEQSFDIFGLESESTSETTFLVKPTESMARHSSVSAETQDRFRYPELPEEGTSYTFDRDTALAREDLLFLTWENPLVEQAMDLVASDVTGNSAVIVVKLKGIKAGTMLVETLHQIECVAPLALNANQYLPPALVRSLITPERQDTSAQIPFSDWDDNLEVPAETIGKIVIQQEAGIKKLLAAANDIAQVKFAPIKTEALNSMGSHLGNEVKRLKALAQVNPNVRPEEVEFLEQRLRLLTSAIKSSQIRLDAVRLIIAA
ncbi:MAG: RNA polymerase-associated protein RapA [Candidatus Azotimanducaceae bacterium WSBS_2022_MAG_OTU7]